MKLTELLCPYDNAELVYEDELDYYFEEDSTHFKEIGFCLKCGRNFHWWSTYKFSHYEDLTED